MKLRRKLLAAGFAFGATALTLTTSTFAWYTSNDEVKVDPINGKTSATADSSSIYIAAAKSYVSASSSISASAPGAKVASITSYGREATPVLVNSGANADRVLNPVYYAGENDYETLSGVASDGTTVNYAKDSTASSVYEFVLRFQKPNATASTPVYVSKFDVTNTAVASDSQQQALAYETDTAGVGVAEEGVYNVDLLHALKMTVAVTPLTNEGKEDASASTTTKVYDLDGFADTSKDVNISSANAVGYYNAVLSTNISEPSNYLSGATCIASTTAGAANSTTSNLFAIPSTGYVEVRFTFWLDGWDSYCYDVCRLQNFQVDMAFTTAADKSVLTTATAA